MAPLSTQRPLRMTAQINNGLFKHAVSLSLLSGSDKPISHLCGIHVRSCMYEAANCLCSQKKGGWFRSAFVRAFTMTYPLNGHPCSDKWIIGAPEEMVPAKGIAGSHRPVAPEKLVSPQSMHTQAHINRPSFTRALPLGKRHTKDLYTTYYLKETSTL